MVDSRWLTKLLPHNHRYKFKWKKSWKVDRKYLQFLQSNFIQIIYLIT